MFLNTHFPGAKKYWHMGTFHNWSEATLHPASHSLHYGTCTFEGIRAYDTADGPAVFRLPDHIDRLLYSASVIKMKPPYTKDEIIEAVKLIVRENGLKSAYIRPLMFYSYGTLGLVPKACPAELFIGAWDWGAYLGENAAKGVSALIVPQRRVHHSQSDMKSKLGGFYVQSAISAMLARAQEYDEAIFLNLEGRIAEGPGENIIIAKGKTVKTNGIEESVLEGITRTTLLEIAADCGYPTKIGPITKEELFGADEAFFSGTAAEITPIIRVTDGSNPKDGKREYVIGDGKPGKIYDELQTAFMNSVTGKVPKRKKWLTYVR